MDTQASGMRKSFLRSRNERTFIRRRWKSASKEVSFAEFIIDGHVFFRLFFYHIEQRYGIARQSSAQTTRDWDLQTGERTAFALFLLQLPARAHPTFLPSSFCLPFQLLRLAPD